MLPSNDWGGGSERFDYKPFESSRVTNYYQDVLPYGRNNKIPNNNRYLESEQPAESWSCPPGLIKEGNKCVCKLCVFKNF